jgi:hypothetical protein
MDRKVVDISFGEVASAIVLKSHAFPAVLGDSSDFPRPLQSGPNNEFGNFLLVNHKDVHQTILRGFHSNVTPSQEALRSMPGVPNPKAVKVFDQTYFDPKNPFNFLRTSQVSLSAKHVQKRARFSGFPHSSGRHR